MKIIITHYFFTKSIFSLEALHSSLIYGASFIDNYPYGNNIVGYLSWKFIVEHGEGEYVVASGSTNSIQPWNFTFGQLPYGYYWYRNGSNLKAKVIVTGTDNDGDVHTSSYNVGIGNVPENSTTGTLSHNETWGGTHFLNGSITIPSGINLKILAGTNVKIPVSSSITVNGSLNVNGIGINMVTFERNGTSGSWGSITISGSSSAGTSISFANILNGTRIEAINTSNITIQNCNISNTYDGVRFSGSTGSVLKNNITTSSAGHGIIIEDASTATCTQNVITKTSTTKTGVGIICRGGSNGTFRQNDISGWDWGVGAIYGSSPGFSTHINGRNNRIRNCNTGIKVYEESWPVISIPTGGQGYNSIYDNSQYNVYFTSGRTLSAYRNYWDGTPSLIYLESGSSIATAAYLDDDPWDGFAKSVTNQENSAEENVISLTKSNTSEYADSLYYGIELRTQDKFIEAKDFFISFINKYPDNQAAYVELYNCYNEETADDIIKFFVTLPGKAAKEHKLLLSYLYLKSGNIEMAKEINNSVAKDLPGSKSEAAAKINNIYISLYRENDIDNAVKTFNQLNTKSLLSSSVELSLVQQAIESYAEQKGIKLTNLIAPDIQSSESSVSDKFELIGNYPNPFNPSTTISYSLPYISSGELIIYDIMGREVRSFTINAQAAGRQSVVWDGRNTSGETIASGIYLYRLKLKSHETNDVFEKTAKLIMLK